MPATVLAAIPSPDRSVWNLGPVPLRAYALCIIAGIVAAIWITEKRWVARGGRRGTVSDVAVWAVVFGLVGGRLYHVVTDNELYFRAGRDPVRALYVWEGGLGIWGAIALGGVGAWIGCRRRGIKLPPFADAAAPGIAVAQAIGRLGNWFNQELFGRPTDLPWGLEISPDKPNTVPGATTYHPTFLYESLWCLGLAGLLVLADRRYRLGRGRVFALYVMGYTAGRVWIELLRIDSANTVFGIRLNVWTSILVFAGALVYFLLHRGPRETEVEPRGRRTDADADAEPDAESGRPRPRPSRCRVRRRVRVRRGVRRGAGGEVGRRPQPRRCAPRVGDRRGRDGRRPAAAAESTADVSPDADRQPPAASTADSSSDEVARAPATDAEGTDADRTGEPQAGGEPATRRVTSPRRE